MSKNILRFTRPREYDKWDKLVEYCLTGTGNMGGNWNVLVDIDDRWTDALPLLRALDKLFDVDLEIVWDDTGEKFTGEENGQEEQSEGEEG